MHENCALCLFILLFILSLKAANLLLPAIASHCKKLETFLIICNATQSSATVVLVWLYLDLTPVDREQPSCVFIKSMKINSLHQKPTTVGSNISVILSIGVPYLKQAISNGQPLKFNLFISDPQRRNHFESCHVVYLHTSRCSFLLMYTGGRGK